MQTILHLTDLHFGWEGADPAQRASREECLDGIIEKLAELEAAWKPTVICLTGDIAWRGTQADYAKAKIWLDRLLAACGLGYESLIVCSGNHDVLREAAKKLGRPHAALEADEVLAPPVAKHYQDVFADFVSFCQNSKIPILKLGTDESYLVGGRMFNGLRFAVVNSAWFCKDDEDQRKLWLGLPQLRQMTLSGQLPKPPITTEEPTTVVLMHHPQEWFHQDDTHATATRPNSFDYLARRCHVLLTGHTHAEVRPPDRPADQALHYTGGATFAGGTHFNSFRLLQIDGDSITDLAFEFDPKAIEDTWRPRLGERRLLGRIPAAKPEAPFDPPDRRCVKFIGRAEVIAQITALLDEGKPLLITGPSGMGKSAVLTETIGRSENASRLREKFPDGVATITVLKGQPADTVYSNICITFHVAQISSAKAAALQFIKGHRALVIIDSAEYFDDFAVFSAAQRAGCVAGASTRLFHDFKGEIVPLSRMPLEDATQMLLEEARVRYDSPVELAAVREICKLIGCLPFAVRLAAVAISQYGGYVPSSFAPVLANSPLDALDGVDEETGRITYLLNNNVSLAQTKGRRVLKYLGLLANGPVPIQILADTSLSSLAYVRAGVADLATSNLVEWADAEKEACVITHTLAHTFAANLVGKDGDDAATLVEELCVACEGFAADREKLPFVRPHIVSLLKGCLSHGMFARAISLTMRLVVQHDPRIAWAGQEEALRLATTAAEAMQDASSSAEILAAQGLHAIVKGQYNEAKSALDRSLSLRTGTPSSVATGQVHMSLARCHFLLGDFTLARREFETARGQFEAVPEGQAYIPDVLVGISVVNYGLAAYQEAKQGYAAAIRAYNSGLSGAAPPELHGFILWRKADALYQLAFTNLVLGSIDEGRANADAALSLATNELGGDSWISGYSLDAQGFFMFHAGELESARDHFERARNFHQLVSDGWGTSLSHTNLGSLLLAMGLVEEAKEQFTQACTLQRRLAESVLRGHTCCALAAIAFMQGNWDAGRQFALEADEISKRTGNERSVAINLLLEAYRLFLSGDFEESSNGYQQGKKVCERISDARGQVRAGYGLARCHLAKSDLVAARKELTATVALATAYQDRLGELALTRLLLQHSEPLTTEDDRSRLIEREVFLSRGLTVHDASWLYHFA